MSIDPVTVEVVRYALEANAGDMAMSLCKTAYNMMIYEVRDFCCGLLDAEGNLLAQNRGGVPLFLSDLGVAIRDGLAKYGRDGFEPGDVLIMNAPYVCGQHLNNVVAYAPCFFKGKLVAFAAVRAHWVDVGGTRVGLGSNATTDIYQEGLQFRSIKIYEQGRLNDGVWQMIQDNIRFPEASLGDLRAQMACCRLGEARLAELFGRYGPDVVAACIEEMWKRSETLSRTAIEAIPDGVYEAETFLDNDGRDLKTPIRIHVKVIVAGETMTVDYSGMNPQVAGSINSGESAAISTARLAFKCLTSPDAPVDEGCFRPLKVVVPEGTLLSARSPAALGQWSVPLPSVIDAIFKALSLAMPGKVPAAHKADLGGYSFFGVRPNGERFLLLNIMGGGWGGRPTEDGPDAAVSIVQGDVRNAPVELQEAMYPFEVEYHRLRRDSGGAGKHRGGLGIELCLKPLQRTWVNIAVERTEYPPWGLEGGQPALPSLGVIRRADGSEETVKKGTHIQIEPGDRVIFLSGGGGGYGDPRQRDRAEIERDLGEGLISEKTARDWYGYVPERVPGLAEGTP